MAPRHHPLRRPLAALALLLAMALPAHAQASRASATTGSIFAAVEIVFAPLTGTGVRSLDFGVINPGVTSATVNPNTAGSGEFRIAGLKSRKSVDITFTLPTQLVGPAGAVIPLNFTGNYAGLCEINDATAACEPASFTSWSPITTPAFHDTPTRYKPGRKVYQYDQYSVYIGGQATPSATQRAGTYTGTVGVTIVVN